MDIPLADRLRPQKLDDFVGQQHLVGKNKVLYNLIQRRNISNMIFYGPSGTGKTTLANIIAAASDRKLFKLNATNASVSDVKSIIDNLDAMGCENGVLLYLDEIQNFNRKQQQSLLEVIENGSVTLIASTTENPYFYIYNAILSRSTVFEFYEIPPNEVKRALLRGIDVLHREINMPITVSDETLEVIAETAGGDVRKALNTLEMCVGAVPLNHDGTIHISTELAEKVAGKKAFRHDRDGDSHYDVLSAFQKSIRGSDPNAAVYYLARILSAGDLKSAARRLLVMASEDVGLAYPGAVGVVKSCVDSALMLGLPEARIPLAEAAVFLATAPKSNSAVMAIDAAMEDITRGYTGDIPTHLKDAHYGGAEKLGHGEGYLYPHSYPNHYVPQQYLPTDIKDRIYYTPGDNKTERAAEEYWNQIKKVK